MKKVRILALAFMTVVIPLPTAAAEAKGKIESRIEVTKPLEIEFGRGSGWHGLDTVRIATNGVVTLYRQSLVNLRRTWETASLQISTPEQKSILDALITNNVLSLKDQIATNVSDGTQWILLVRQDSASQAIYFDNFFPSQIKNFANSIDAVLNKTPIQWKAATGEPRAHEKDLWNAIRDRKK